MAGWELQAHAADDPSTIQVREAKTWIRLVLALVGVGIGLGLASLVVLAATNRLPAPPLSATVCIDEKLAFMRTADLESVNLIAVGSSATWRNLDMARLEKSLPGVRAFNAATCYLHVDQTAFLADLILELTPKIKTVVTILTPRDFENCDARDSAIADPALLRAYLTRALPGWPIYLINFRPMYFAVQAINIKAQREGLLGSDRYGSSPLYARTPDYNPAPVFDKRCFAALRTLEGHVAARGARLVVATIPVKPDWAMRFDPDGRIINGWIEEMRAHLGSRALLVDGRRLSWPTERFADPVHLLWPEGAEYSQFLASAITAAVPR